MTSTHVYGKLLSKPLSYATRVIREATDGMANEFIRSALDLVTSQEKASSLRINVVVQGNAEASFPKNPNLVITSWIKLHFHLAYFRWGKPLYSGPRRL